jgi:hypothetical protein
MVEKDFHATRLAARGVSTTFRKSLLVAVTEEARKNGVEK